MTQYQAYPDYKDSGVPWLGLLPLDWEVVRVKFVADLVNEKVEPDVGDRFIGLENVSSWTGCYLEPGEVAKPEGICNRYYPDCVLFGKLRPYLAKSLRVADQGICSSEFLVLRSRRVISRFLQYFTLTDEFIRQVDSSTYGAKMPRASWEFVGSVPTPVPSPQEQEVVGEFLDHETAKIDRLIAKQERLIELLKEKRQAVISHAVTKGLNPDAPMKDSGVEWLGEVPAHWEVLKFSVATSIRNGQVDPRTEPYSEYILIAPNHIESGTGRLLATETAAVQGADSGKYRCKAGEVIYSKIRPALAKACMSPSDQVLCSADMYPIHGRGELSNAYLLWFMLTKEFTAFATLASDRVAMPKINREALAECRVPVPPADEQAQIEKFLESSLFKIDTLVEKADHAIALMKEHRTALISATVTGKIDVRNWQPPAADSLKSELTTTTA